MARLLQITEELSQFVERETATVLGFVLPDCHNQVVADLFALEGFSTGRHAMPIPPYDFREARESPFRATPLVG